MTDSDLGGDLANIILNRISKEQNKNKQLDFNSMDNSEKCGMMNDLFEYFTLNFKSSFDNSQEMKESFSEFTSRIFCSPCTDQAGPSSIPCAIGIASEEVLVIHGDSSDESGSSCNNENIIPSPIVVSKIKSIPEKPSKINAIFSNFANSLPFCIANIYSLKAELRSARKIINGVGWKIFVTTHFHKNHNDSDKSLSFYVQCCPNSYDDRWNVKANCELSIYSHANKCWKVGYQFSHVFNSKYDDCGLVHFIKWKDLFDSDEKYALDGKVYLEAIIDVKGLPQITNYGEYNSRLEKYSSIFDMQMSRGNKRKAEEVCNLALNYCLKTDRKFIKIFEEKRSLLVQDKVADTITRLQQEHLQNVEKGTSLKKKNNLRNFYFTGCCKKSQQTCNHIEKNEISFSTGKIKKTEIIGDNHECESNKENVTFVEKKPARQYKVCDCGNLFSGSLEICKNCENQYFMRRFFFETGDLTIPFTVYNKKRLFNLPENYIVRGPCVVANRSDMKIEKFIREYFFKKSLHSARSNKKNIVHLDSIFNTQRNNSIENFYYDKTNYLNFIAKRTSIISRYLDNLSKNTPKETKKLVIQFYENNQSINKNKLLSSIKDDALAFYLRIIPFWLDKENDNTNKDSISLNFDNDKINDVIKVASRSVNNLKKISGNKVKDDKISLFCTNIDKSFENSNSLSIVPKFFVESIKEILLLWSTEFERFTHTMKEKQKHLVDDNDRLCKQYKNLQKNFIETKEMFDNLSKNYSIQAKTVSLLNEVKKKCEEYKKENEILVRNNQSIADSKKNMAKELANLKEQNRLLTNQINEKNAALKKLKKIAEQEKIASNKENEILRARCIRSELMYLEKHFSTGIKELNKAKEEALEYIDIMKNSLKDINEKYINIVYDKIKEFEDYICQIEEKIEIATQNHKIHSASIEEGKCLSQIGKIKIQKPKALPEKLNTNLFTKLDVVWCDNLTSQSSSVRNGRVNNKEMKTKSNGFSRKKLNSSPTSDAFSCSSGESRMVKDVFTDCGYYITSVSPISYDNTLNTYEISNFLASKMDSKLKYGPDYQNSNHSMFSPTNSSSSFEGLQFPNTTNVFGKQSICDNNQSVLQNLDYIASYDSILTPKKDEVTQWYVDSDVMMGPQNVKQISHDGSFDLKKYTRDCDKMPSDDYQALYKAFCSSNSQKSDW
uniref:MATH domain-containing protein n=1 Tax=Strongyloides papillosus TaxID=174720 RepID=A0A0N5BPN8_STREA